MSDIRVTHGRADVPGDSVGPHSFTLGNTVDPDKSILMVTNNRQQSGGPVGLSGNQTIAQMGAFVQFFDGDTIQFIHSGTGAASSTYRTDYSVMEYTGPVGGANEFKILDVVLAQLDPGETSKEFSVDDAFGADLNDVVPIITSLTATGAQRANEAEVIVTAFDQGGSINIRVERGASNETVNAQITVVGFTGSNWSVRHGRVNSDLDSGDIPLRQDADGLTGAVDGVSDWDNAMIFHQHFGDNTNVAIEDTSAIYFPTGLGTDLDNVAWIYSAGHLTSGASHMVHVVENADMNVTLYSDTTSHTGAQNIDITSAGLTDIETALPIVSRYSSGGGTAYGRGWVNIRLTSTTNAEQWVHRNGNTIFTVVQIVDFENVEAAAAPQTIECDDVPSSEAFGVPTLQAGAVVITIGRTGSVGSSEAFGSPSLAAGAVQISPADLASAEAFGSPALLSGAVQLTPTGVVSAEAFGSPALQVGAVLIELAVGIASTEAFGSHTLATGQVTVSPSGIPSQEQAGSPVLIADLQVLPFSIASQEAVGLASLNIELITIQVAGIGSAQVFGTPVLTNGANILPTGVASAEAFGSPLLLTQSNILAASVASAEAFGTPLLEALGALLPNAIASAEAFGVAELNALSFISPAGIASGEVLGNPALQAPALITVASIASAEAFGFPTLNALSYISPVGIASGEAFGTTILQRPIEVGGIPSEEVVGVLVLVQGAQITPSGIMSGESFGTHELVAGVGTVVPLSIASAEAFGSPEVVAEVITILAAQIASAEAFGSPSLVAQEALVFPAGIESSEAFGTAELAPGAVSVVAGNIASAEAFGTPELLSDVVAILPSGIVSGEALGTPEVLLLQQFISPSGIESGEALGQPLLFGDSTDIICGSIPSAEEFGRPFCIGGDIAVTLKKKIHDALIAAAKQGTFVVADYDPDTCELVQGLQVQPGSCEANEVASQFRIEGRHGRYYRQDRAQWQWLLILRFHQEVITELFENELIANPICIPREDGDNQRQGRLRLLDATPSHPPRQGASNGTEVTYRFSAELSAV